ncbi:AMM_1a_G0031150.mRNA.1.CDS.1 [Saccharomyces cerevisiae]|nr:AMM_1a_G0031150.mRNA.1.CDS.1 [Saccharomyces cerevisiae]CAI6755142.1 AMM_1a_G0031150.mRNA.1.CDS.1 [Saccharomyces cerevisiae]
MARRCIDTGLNRWEYYVGQDENIAQCHRELFWDSYWWDRWYALVTGKQPLISEEMTSCLFPKEVIGLGVDDSMDCLTLVNSVEMDPTKIDACISFGRILLAKVITLVFSGMLYNRKFTDYRLFAMEEASNFNTAARKLQGEYLNVNTIFQLMQDKLVPFFENKFEDSRVFELYIHFELVENCCYQGIESLMLRIQNILTSNEKVEFDMCIKQLGSQSFELSPRKIFICHLSLICDVVSSLNTFFAGQEFTKIENHETFSKRLQSSVTVTFILLRICCQVYMKSQNLSKQLLLIQLEELNRSFSNTAQAALDIECIWYQK